MKTFRILSAVFLAMVWALQAAEPVPAKPVAPMVGPTRAAAAEKAAATNSETKRAQPVPQQEEQIDEPDGMAPPIVNMSLDWASRYVYQGRALNTRPVGIIRAEINKGEAYFGVRGVYDFTSDLERNGKVGRRSHGLYDSDRKWRFQENRFYIGDTMATPPLGKLGPLYLDLSWTYIQYPGVSDLNSAEIGLSITAPDVSAGEDWALVPVLSLNHDYELETSWISAAGYYSKSLGARCDLELSSELFWGDTKQARFYTGGECDGNAFYAAVFGICLNVHLTEEVILAPYLKTAIHPDSRCRKAMRDDGMNHGCELWGGVVVSVAF